MMTNKIIINNQLHERPERKDRSAPNGFGRDGKPKTATTTTPAIHGGMKSQTRSGGVHPWLHGQALGDTAPDKPGYGVTPAIHNAMGSETPEHRGADYGPDEAGRVLGDSLKISTPHGSARLDRAARLPTKNVGR